MSAAVIVLASFAVGVLVFGTVMWGPAWTLGTLLGTALGIGLALGVLRLFGVRP